ncbi:NAD-dependent epimerase/dehydratase family protein [Desulfobaculum bizertense]|uniref:UDP-glucose 4-epimerase n=1 Tax=Desulfobaculum bizertense DSM 18034 TaxID=1121442 RepID=A0A1T4VN97_9BACT|nr:GDP-mannose 4,6-dehydratase [Desulfobaculum bizertense]SKA66409.1 UDP-glucose 4-epimerase [Desulfobaculum bizertense DSM 18034]
MQFYSGKKVLITGGCGFIGSNLAIRLVQAGADVTVVDSMIEEYGGNLYNIEPVKNDIHLNISDVRDQVSMKYLIRNQEVIFNLAGQVSHIDSMHDPFTDLEINAKAQLGVLEACRHGNRDARIVLTSTRQIYGKPHYMPVDEKHPLDPVDVNGINCIAGEWYHLLYNKVYGIPTSVLRLTNTYGPRQLLKHNRQGFLGWFIRLVAENKQIQLYGDGLQRRDMNYVEDVVDALLVAGQKEQAVGQVYNLAGDEPISLKSICEKMIATAKSGSFKLVPWPEEKKKIDIGDFYGDCSKITAELGWKPTTTTDQGLEKTFEYYRPCLDQYIKDSEQFVCKP